MFRKIVALLMLVSASVVGTTAMAAADPYSPKIPTVTTIEITVQGPGEPAIIHVSAAIQGNSSTVPEGDIAVRLFAGNAAERPGVAARTSAKPLLATTVHFVDDPVRIQGPALPKGTYTGTAAFTPTDPTTYLPSSDSTRVRVGAGGPGDDSDNGGALPDTGGPNMMWLLLGAGLVVAGAGSVTFARRRTPAAA